MRVSVFMYRCTRMRVCVFGSAGILDVRVWRECV